MSNGGVPQSFVCSSCDNQFSTIVDLKLHEIHHQEGKSCECDVCLVSFSHPSDLAYHLLNHDKKQLALLIVYRIALKVELQWSEIFNCGNQQNVYADAPYERITPQEGTEVQKDQLNEQEEPEELLKHDEVNESSVKLENSNGNGAICLQAPPPAAENNASSEKVGEIDSVKLEDGDVSEDVEEEYLDHDLQQDVPEDNQVYSDFIDKDLDGNIGVVSSAPKSNRKIKKLNKVCRQLEKSKLCNIYTELREIILNGAPFQCPECNKIYDKKHVFVRHFKGIHRSDRAHCKICNKRFPTEEIYKSHLRSHSEEEKPYCCEICDKHFTCNRSYANHMRHFHSDKKQQFKCDVCSKTFDSRQNYNRHLAVHTTDRIHQCHICPKSYKTLDILKDHIKSHSEVKPFQCTLCEKSFIKMCFLNYHMASHRGEKKFVCEHCGNSYMKKHTLLVHKRLHTGEKPHVCEICNKTFRRHKSWKVHMNVHTGEKPHQCSICGNRFGDPGNLRKHIQGHSNVKPHTCPICFKGFVRPDALRKHMKGHDGMNMDMNTIQYQPLPVLYEDATSQATTEIVQRL